MGASSSYYMLIMHAICFIAYVGFMQYICQYVVIFKAPRLKETLPANRMVNY